MINLPSVNRVLAEVRAGAGCVGGARGYPERLLVGRGGRAL